MRYGRLGRPRTVQARSTQERGDLGPKLCRGRASRAPTTAFTPYGLELARASASHICGPYRIPNLRIELKAVYTNTMMCTPYRGAGRPHACFVVERVLDKLARELRIDRIEIRRRNFVRHDGFPHRREGLVTVDGFTVALDSVDHSKQLDMLLEAIEYERFREEQAQARKEGRYVGFGLACYVESTGGGPYVL